MCLAVYLASSTEIPASLRGDPDVRAFYLKGEPPGVARVRRHFSVPHVYYAGSHEGCGCGFSREARDEQELRQCQTNYAALGQCIRFLQAQGATLELFSCWEGRQGDNPDCSETLAVEGIEDPAFEFREGHFVSVR